MKLKKKIAILGGGNIGQAFVEGLLQAGVFEPFAITITRRNVAALGNLASEKVNVTDNNIEAVKNADIILFAVQPNQIGKLVAEIKDYFNPQKHTIMSVISTYTTDDFESAVGKDFTFIRVMPNTAMSICESMTCLACNKPTSEKFEEAKAIFEQLGTMLVIDEKLMPAATILCACGIAYFLRVIRAASQGGIQVGFHANEAQLIAAQTAKGATSLLLKTGHHPEMEIDKVTTPLGCTIKGLNEMEHNGFSSAFIKGIVSSFEEIDVRKK
jgi:pyrroline-5-carboxylate reductase